MKCKVPQCQAECHIGKEYCVQHYKEHGDYVYGMDADIKKKMDAKLNMNDMAQAQAWIEALTGSRFPGNDAASFHAHLKTGVVLCETLNAIKPGTVKKISKSNMPFNQRENIVQYLEGCKRVGQREVDLFVSQDLFEGDNIGSVVNQIISLGGTVQTQGWYKGPKCGVKKAEGQASNWKVGQASNVVPKLMQGSYGVQDETRNPVLDRQIIRDHTNHKAGGDVPKQNQGAIDVERERRLDQINRNVDQYQHGPQAAKQKQAGGNFCGGCGQKREGLAKFCPSCGNKF